MKSSFGVIYLSIRSTTGVGVIVTTRLQRVICHNASCFISHVCVLDTTNLALPSSALVARQGIRFHAMRLVVNKLLSLEAASSSSSFLTFPISQALSIALTSFLRVHVSSRTPIPAHTHTFILVWDTSFTYLAPRKIQYINDTRVQCTCIRALSLCSVSVLMEFSCKVPAHPCDFFTLI